MTAVLGGRAPLGCAVRLSCLPPSSSLLDLAPALRPPLAACAGGDETPRSLCPHHPRRGRAREGHIRLVSDQKEEETSPGHQKAREAHLVSGEWRPGRLGLKEAVRPGREHPV